MDVETILWCVESIQKLVLLWEMLMRHIVILRYRSLLIIDRARKRRYAMHLIAILIVRRYLMMNMWMNHASLSFNVMMNVRLSRVVWLVCIHVIIELFLLDNICWSAKHQVLSINRTLSIVMLLFH